MLKQQIQETAPSDWLEGYNLSIDGVERKKYLAIGLSMSQSPENLLRETLWELRFTRNGKITGMDFFLAQWMNLNYLYKNTSVFLKRRNRKILEKSWKNLMFEAGTDDIRKEVLRQEYQNTAAIYIELCNQDKNYDKLFLGFKSISEEQLISKIAFDVYATGWGTPQMFHMEKEFQLLSIASRDAFFFAYPYKSRVWEMAIEKFESIYIR